MQLHIPFFSQLDNSVPQEHQRKVCALACVKMIIDSSKDSISFERIFKEALIVGSYEQAGWTHETIVRILRNHGILAYRQEFLAHTINVEDGSFVVASHTDSFIQKGIDKIKQSIIAGNPVCVSVIKGFSNNKEDHMVLVVGYEEDALLIYDPLVSQDQNPRKISIEEFVTFWKKFAIFVEYSN